MIAFLMSVVLGAALIVAAPVAAASDASHTGDAGVPELTSAEVSEIGENLVDLGVKKAVRARLLSKLEAGQVPDSARGVEPVRSWTNGPDGMGVTTYEYADGSRSRVGVRSGVTPLVDISGPDGADSCATEGAGYYLYLNCIIYSENFWGSAGFTADFVFTFDHERFPARIMDPRGKYCYMVVAKSTCELSWDRLVADPPEPARVTMDLTWESAGGIAGGQTQFWLNVEPAMWYIDESQLP